MVFEKNIPLYVIGGMFSRLGGVVLFIPLIADIGLNMSNNLKITQDNSLVSAAYVMSLNEKRLLIMGIARIRDDDHKKRHSGGVVFEITAAEWGDSFGISDADAYKELKRAGKSLYNRSVYIKERNSEEHLRWISSYKYYSGEGRVSITFSGAILTYLSGLLDQFTSYDLLSVTGLKSMHSIRIYELARQFISTGIRIITVDDLRHILGLETAYPQFKDFRKSVIDKACNEINKKSDIEISWEPIKRGRVIKSIKFHIAEKEQMDLFPT